MTKNNLVIIAKILKPHGVRGAVKVQSFAQVAQNIFNMNLYDSDGKKILLKLLYKKDSFFIAKIDSVEDMDAAKNISNNYLFANTKEFPELKEDEFYISELIGRTVYGTDKNQIGIVHQVHNFGAGDLLEIKFTTGESEMIIFDVYNFPIVNNKEIVLDIERPIK